MSLDKKIWVVLALNAFLIILCKGDFNSITYTCPEGWGHIKATGVSCYCFFGFDTKLQLTWENSLRICQSYGSTLAVVNDYYESEEIRKLMKKYSLGTETLWIGMNRIGIKDTDLEAAKWNDKFPDASLYEGHWANNNPDVTQGDCVYLQFRNDESKWHLSDCNIRMAYVCERNSCPMGSFFCNNGACISDQWKCDGEDDCGDFSDENDCKDTCRTMLTATSGTIKSDNYPGLYEPSSNCRWTIIGDEGTHIQIEITNMDTEEDVDYIQILVGGKTETTAYTVATLSGQSSEKQQYKSHNNFLIIKFVSDPRYQKTGFTLTYNIVPDTAPYTINLSAGNDPVVLTPPNFPSAYQGLRDYTWLITAESKRKIVTIERLSIDLHFGDIIQLQDGSSATAPVLFTYASYHNDDAIKTATGPQFVSSTGNQLFILLKARAVTKRTGFKFRYWQGCDVKLTSVTGEIFSPGYSGAINYANYQTCTWMLNVTNERGITLFFSWNSKLQSDRDFLKIYTETTDTNETKAIHTGVSVASSFFWDVRNTGVHSSNGQMFIKLVTDAVVSDRGFYGVYSVDCPDPKFNNHTIITGSQKWRYRDSITVSCEQGYSMLPDRVPVYFHLKCELGGKWDKIIPQCQRVYCGFPPPLDNGYYVNSTGVEFESQVYFDCYPGYYMVGDPVITCQSNVQWSKMPRCLDAVCPTPTDVVNAKISVVEGDRTSFGSIIKYECNPGYELVGIPLLFCKGHNSWSSVPPSCKKLSCFVPEINNGKLTNGGKDVTNQLVTFEGQVSVLCDEGYEQKSVNKPLCNSSLTFDKINPCENIDECAAGTSGCVHDCHDNNGSYTCACNNGYILNKDGKSCDDILECDVDNGGCDHNCTDVPGGYQCGCYKGYQMFTKDDKVGVSLATSETGFLKGDKFRYNHSCVRVLCPEPPTIDNGQLQTHRQQHHFGDTLYYDCYRGYSNNGSYVYTCTSDGQWSPQPFPSCQAVTCEVKNYTAERLANPPYAVSHDGEVGYNDTLVIYCFVPGKGNFTKEQRCEYDSEKGKYFLYGESFECGEIDCGTPVSVNGADFIIPNNTLYGSTFNFTCSEYYFLDGNSSTGDVLVTCMADGIWDFGSLQCLKKACSDPGYPVGGSAVINIESLLIDGNVTFKCDRAGFAPDPSTGIQCVYNRTMGEGQWNATIPTCVDVTKPAFIEECEVSREELLYSSFSWTQSNVTDNSGSVDSYTVEPVTATILVTVSTTNMIAIFRAKDHANNEEVCYKTVNVTNEVPPKFPFCPPSRIEYVDDQIRNISVIEPSTWQKLTGYFGPSIELTVSGPNKLTSYEDIGPHLYRLQASDGSSRTDQCSFQIDIRARVCWPGYLPEPLHGTKICRHKVGNTGYECDIACDNEYYLFDYPEKTFVTMECSNKGQWNIPIIPACTQGYKIAMVKDIIETEVNTTPRGCIRANLMTDKPLITNVQFNTPNDPHLSHPIDYLRKTDGNGLSIQKDEFTITLTGIKAPINGIIVYGSNIQNVYIKTKTTGSPKKVPIITGKPNQEIPLENRIYSFISISIRRNSELLINSPFSTITDHFKRSVRSPIIVDSLAVFSGCVPFPIIERKKIPKFTIAPPDEKENIKPESLPEPLSLAKKDPECPEKRKFFQIDKETFCFACPEGMFSTGNGTCDLCAQGTYNNQSGVNNCEDCPVNMTTPTVGSTSINQCTVQICLDGLVSPTGFPPCTECPRGQYWVNHTSCEDCPNNMTTHQTGATSEAQCYDKCQPGFFSYNGYEPNCRICPLHYYQPNSGATDCIECPGNATTLSVNSTDITDCVDAEPLLCQPNTCLNNGNCTVKNHVYVCECPVDTYGRNCEYYVDHCLSSPCYNDATCISTYTGYSCTCGMGLTGVRCEVDVDDECKKNTCDKFGVCLNKINGYECVCREEISGKRCENQPDICAEEPCLNNGTCLNYNNVRRKCSCQPGFSGVNCQTNINECYSNPCYHGATCEDRVSGYLCRCLPGYSGSRCENRASPCRDCNGGTCVDNFNWLDSTFSCICDVGLSYGDYCDYELSSSIPNITGSKMHEKTNLSACLELCGYERDSCLGIAYFSAEEKCYTFASPLSDERSSYEGARMYTKKCIRPTGDFYTPWYNIDSPKDDGIDDERLSELGKLGISVCDGQYPVGAECRVSGQTWILPKESVNCQWNGSLCTNITSPCEDYEIRYRCEPTGVFVGTTCLSQNYCKFNKNPCLHGGTCNDVVNSTFSCSCLSGYTGSICQHNIDDCASVTCLNGGTCVDQVDSFTCSCAEGFSGSICQDNINDCASKPCVNGECVDGVSDYSCMCRPGFTGKNCSINIDECASQPCLHGGTCKDATNDYLCTCLDGWKGKQCSVIIDVCNATSPPCAADSDCSSLFDDYFCHCKDKRYGRHCESRPDSCRDVDPCVNTGTCTQKDDQPNCACPSDYAGPGCELVVDHCKDDKICQNGGTCVTLTNQIGYRCQCVKGFMGKHCETNSDDCFHSPCPSDSSCIDLVDDYICRCNLGKTGKDCQKEINTDYDIYFYLPTRNGYAALPYAIKLSGQSFSISMWVKFLDSSYSQTYFNIFSVRDISGLEDPEQLIEITRAGVKLYNDGSAAEIQEKYNKIEDGRWHHIVLTWDNTEGVNFIIDTINQGQRIDIWSGQTFDKTVWLVLGGKVSTLTKQPFNQQGFRGYISQLTMYNRVLEFETEIPALYENPRTVYNGTTLLWSEFILHSGAQPVYPSKAAKDAEITRLKEIDKTPPSTSNCPSDIYKYSKDRYTTVNWTEPTFHGAVKIYRKYRPGEIFTWGKYQMTYEAIDDAGNSVFCSFNIYVQTDQCSDPIKPAGVISTCTEKYSPFIGCSVRCLDATRKITVEHPLLYTCGPSGNWEPKNKFKPFRFPTCGNVDSVVDKKLNVVLTYPQITTRNCLGVRQALQEEVISTIRTIHLSWGTKLCQFTDCSDVTVSVECFMDKSRTKRGVMPTTVYMNIPQSNGTLMSTSGEVLTVEDVVTRSVLDHNDFDYSVTIPEGYTDINGFSLAASDVCGNNATAVGGFCVNCGLGTYYDSTTGTCINCPKGQFTDTDGQTECEPCPAGTTTQYPGTDDMTLCLTLCDPGYFYNLATTECEACGEGYYQESAGMFECERCDAGKITRNTSTASADLCFDACPSGQELSVEGLCIHCPKGTYRKAEETKLCVACPVENTTLLTGSTSKEECNLKACEAGYKRVGMDACEKCPVGTYQPQKWQTECISCGGEHYRTDQEASTDATDCKFWCESGYQPTSTLTCEPCSNGYFKDNTLDIYGFCLPCPSGKTTAGTATTSISDCSLLLCEPGHMSDGTKCIKCPQGYYQTNHSTTDCLKCPWGTSTENKGTDSASKCYRYCDSGQEVNTNGSCVDCGIGYYKDNNENLFMRCTACPLNYITGTPRSPSVHHCSIRTCQPGSMRTIDEAGCIPCPEGTYNDLPYQKVCKTCPDGTWTKWIGALSSTECLSFCQSGFVKDENDKCEPCPRGYYKDNKEGVFSLCEPCPSDKITPSTGAVSLLQCTVGNCTAGNKVDGDSCLPCPVGTYQPEKWQTNCIPCPISRTTLNSSSESMEDCFLICGPGYEKKEEICVKCQKGFYKDTTGIGSCTACPALFSTSLEGAVSDTDCKVPDCPAGHKNVNNKCVKCGYDYYQPLEKQTECVWCGPGYTTFDLDKATSKDQCHLDCASGNEIDPANDNLCIACKRGFYRDGSVRSMKTCQACPADFTTVAIGATSEKQCSVRKCVVPGEYINPASNLCTECPLGTYNALELQMSCTLCPSNFTTTSTRSTSLADCKPVCDSGKEPQGAQCFPCPAGKFRDKVSSNLFCQPCPGGFITSSVGATSSFQCNTSPCIIGEYFNTETRSCEKCALDHYQDISGQFACKRCPSGRYTEQLGSISVAACTSYCVDETKNNCSAMGFAECLDDAVNGYICLCAKNYVVYNGVCTHQCDTGYCVRGTCIRNPVTCVCPEQYVGKRCETIKSTTGLTITEKVIAGSISGGVGLLIIVGLIVCCVTLCGRRTTVARVDSPLIREPTPEPIYCTAHHNTCCDADSLYDSHICQPSITYDHFFGGFGPKNVLHFRSKRDSFPDYVDQKKQLRTDNSVIDVDQLADRETVYHNDAAYSQPAVYIAPEKEEQT